MIIAQILGLLVNSTDYGMYLQNDDTKMSLFGKFIIWYLCTIVGIIFSICAAAGL